MTVMHECDEWADGSTEYGAPCSECVRLNRERMAGSITRHFAAEALLIMRPRAEIERWLSGARMVCPAGCGELVPEGDDCSQLHFDQLEGPLWALMNATGEEA